MSKVVNVHAAKTHLSRLVDEAAKGTVIIIAKAGRPVAQLIAAPSTQPRKPGLLQGRIQMSDDFNAPLPDDLLALFEGKPAPAPRKAKARK
jgi:prevent-host-death family protein